MSVRAQVVSKPLQARPRSGSPPPTPSTAALSGLRGCQDARRGAESRAATCGRGVVPLRRAGSSLSKYVPTPERAFYAPRSGHLRRARPAAVHPQAQRGVPLPQFRRNFPRFQPRRRAQSPELAFGGFDPDNIERVCIPCPELRFDPPLRSGQPRPVSHMAGCQKKKKKEKCTAELEAEAVPACTLALLCVCARLCVFSPLFSIRGMSLARPTCVLPLSPPSNTWGGLSRAAPANRQPRQLMTSVSGGSFRTCPSSGTRMYESLGWMGPTMPPSKKAQSPSSGASASQGMSPPYRQGDAATAASEAEAADLSLSLSASFSKAEDEELTSLSWLHESTDLLNSFSHSGLRSVSPLQDPDGQHPRSPSSSSPSPDDPLLGDAHSAYDLAAGANRKPPYSFSCLIFMAIEDAPNKRLPVKDIYGWILEHFPYFASAPTGWKNSVRHNLSLNKCFKKVDKDRSQSIGKGSLWSIDPEYRHNLIQALKKTPYHPYSPGLATPSTSPPTLPQTFHHSPPLWSGSPLFRKNGEVLLQDAHNLRVMCLSGWTDGGTDEGGGGEEADGWIGGGKMKGGGREGEAVRKGRFSNGLESALWVGHPRTSGDLFQSQSVMLDGFGWLPQAVVPLAGVPSPRPAAFLPEDLSASLLHDGANAPRRSDARWQPVPRGVIQNGARVRSQALFPVIRPLPVSPVGSRTSAIRSSIGDYLTRGQDSPSRYSPLPCSEDLQDDHTYSTAKSPSRLCSSQVADPSSPLDDDDDIIAVEIQSDIKPEPREIPLDSHVTTAAATYISQQPLRGQRRSSGAGAGTLAGSSLPWTKNRARGISDTLPLKKRRAAAVEKPPESDDEEMKEAAGSLLHLAGVRACLNNITNRTAKGQKEQKEALRN
ncbi:hypothetical protein L3Q82_011290 [Scortum barcoo]|uniref:Uncharacterized protein n=1 Tax=Scortum barcoo TaxID=214431 RepID=A0ACB8W9V8_9TELE|nr:hypothetical protein L3Q82_011290 [Scortum barcoo]